MMRCLSICLVAAGLYSLPVAGVTISDFAAKSLTTDDGPLPYREVLVNANGAGRPALAIYLHGASGRGSDNVRQMRQDGIYSIYDSMESRGIRGYLLVPQCPEDRYWPGNRDYEPYTDPVKQLIRLYMEENGVDTNRIYIFGASMGGAGTWRIISEMPGVFAATLVASGDYRDSLYDALAGTPAYLTVGGEEGESRIANIQGLAESIAAAGGETRFDVLSGLDHADTCVDSFSDERIGWVFGHVRNASAPNSGLSTGITNDFVRIPANPSFAFAKSLNPHSSEAGEASPILKPYYICRHPVTNAEYAEFTTATGHRTPGYWNGRECPQGRERHPVLSVSYTDVLAFCEWKSARTPGWKFRVPTEAEWENAANGATVGNYNAVIATKLLTEDPDRLVTYYHEKSTRRGEQDKLSDVISVSASGAVSGWVNHANYTGFVYTDLFKSINDAGGYTMDWDAFPACASRYGVLDMLGNSWDWTCSVIVAVNGAEAGQSVNAVRGGSWYATKASCALTYRGEGRAPRTCFATVGFRLVAISTGMVVSIR